MSEELVIDAAKSAVPTVSWAHVQWLAGKRIPSRIAIEIRTTLCHTAHFHGRLPFKTWPVRRHIHLAQR